MANAESLNLDSIFELQSPESGESIDLFTNELLSILLDPNLLQRFSESRHKSLEEYVVARSLHRFSRPDIDLKVFRWAVMAAYAMEDNDTCHRRRTWSLMYGAPEVYLRRLKAKIVENNILEVMAAGLVAKKVSIRLDGNDLLKLAIAEQTKKNGAEANDLAVIRFLIDFFSLDVSDLGTMSGESAMDLALRSGNSELIQLLQQASAGNDTTEGKTGNNGLPAKFKDIVEKCIVETRSRLEKGKKILGQAYVGNTQTGHIRTLPFSPTNDMEMKIATETVRKIAEAEHADFTLTIAESWSVVLEVPQDACCDRSSSNFLAPPRSIDTCVFRLDSDEGFWVALAEIKPKGHSKKGRTFSNVTFRSAEKNSDGVRPSYRINADSLLS